MADITILDNGKKTFDRYTIIVEDWENQPVYDMSENPLSPQGFNQFCGYAKDMQLDKKKSVSLIDLPKSVLIAIIQRI